jgi:hypothetical protein
MGIVAQKQLFSWQDVENIGDGTAWQKVVSWFGYRLHLIVDTNYELVSTSLKSDCCF